MIYIIGGAGCSGKSTMSRKLLAEKSVSYFSLDVLFVGLSKGVPELDIHDAQKSEKRAEKMWPVVHPMISNVVEYVQVDYTFEGSFITPVQVSVLQKEYPNQIRACFLGYTDRSPEETLKAVRNLHGKIPNDWLYGLSDEYVLEFAKGMNTLSVFFKGECEKYNLPYFDVSTNYEENFDRAYSYLTSK